MTELKTWRVLDTGSSSASLNMAVSYTVLDTLRPWEEETKELMADKYTQQRWNTYAQQ